VEADRWYNLAVCWFRKVATQGGSGLWGDVNAQFNLGYAYSTGEGVPQDYAEAVSWTRQAADQGEARAQYNLGVLYGAGEGVPQDYAEAVSWYRQAADQGYTAAQSNLGLMYYTGEGVPQDDVEAHKWFNLAASRASAENQKRYAERRDGVAEEMNPQQVEDAQQRATDWLTAFEQRN
jgi:TPR repeat protein